MDTLIRLACGLMAVVVLCIIIWRRRNKAVE
jgi:hypothetical protein